MLIIIVVLALRALSLPPPTRDDCRVTFVGCFIGACSLHSYILVDAIRAASCIAETAAKERQRRKDGNRLRR